MASILEGCLTLRVHDIRKMWISPSMPCSDLNESAVVLERDHLAAQPRPGGYFSCAWVQGSSSSVETSETRSVSGIELQNLDANVVADWKSSDGE